jgi:hypothetical protein
VVRKEPSRIIPIPRKRPAAARTPSPGRRPRPRCPRGSHTAPRIGYSKSPLWKPSGTLPKGHCAVVKLLVKKLHQRWTGPRRVDGAGVLASRVMTQGDIGGVETPDGFSLVYFCHLSRSLFLVSVAVRILRSLGDRLVLSIIIDDTIDRPGADGDFAVRIRRVPATTRRSH